MCLILLVIWLYMLIVFCLSFSLCLSLYLYFVYDCYNNNYVIFIASGGLLDRPPTSVATAASAVGLLQQHRCRLLDHWLQQVAGINLTVMTCINLKWWLLISVADNTSDESPPPTLQWNSVSCSYFWTRWALTLHLLMPPSLTTQLLTTQRCRQSSSRAKCRWTVTSQKKTMLRNLKRMSLGWHCFVLHMALLPSVGVICCLCSWASPTTLLKGALNSVKFNVYWSNGKYNTEALGHFI